MARRRSGGPTDALEEIHSLTERLATWVAAHAVLALAIAGGILLSAAGTGVYLSWSTERADRASAAVAAVRAEFVVAMGGTPGDVEVREPANPETGLRVREEFAGRFLEVAAGHAGTAEAALALLEAGDLLTHLGRPEAALEAWQRALAGVGQGSALRAVLLVRSARAHEAAGRFEEAAEAHRRAGSIEAFPLRHVALADAGRCYAEAGRTAEALTLYERLRSEAEGKWLPPHVMTRLRELEALRQAPPATP